MLFHLSLCDPAEQARVIAGLDEEAARFPAHVAARLAPALTGLRQAAAGAAPDSSGGRLLLGWTNRSHWLAQAPGGSRHAEPRTVHGGSRLSAPAGAVLPSGLRRPGVGTAPGQRGVRTQNSLPSGSAMHVHGTSPWPRSTSVAPRARSRAASAA